MSTPSTHVVIAGGGVAGLEAALALRELAGDRVRLTIVSPRADFVLTPLAVSEPFAVGHARRRPLAEIATELAAVHVPSAVARVLPHDHAVVLSDGRRLAYDALLLAPGAHPVAAFGRVVTFFAERDPIALNGLLADLEEAWSRSVAFVIPPGVTWTLPAYELALLTARDVRAMGIDEISLSIVTPERRPLALFGEVASDAIGRMLDEAGIALHCRARVEQLGAGRLTIDGRTMMAERVVSLPLLEGPHLRGVPRDVNGFVPIDDHARVRNLHDVYAAGDGADYPIKQGGLATQQADAAAEMIAAAAGAAVAPRPFRPVLRGWLLTGGPRTFLTGPVVGPGGAGQASRTPLWWPPTKVAGRYLGPWLQAQEPQLERPSHVEAVAIDMKLPTERKDAAAMALDPLGRLPQPA